MAFINFLNKNINMKKMKQTSQQVENAILKTDKMSTTWSSLIVLLTLTSFKESIFPVLSSCFFELLSHKVHYTLLSEEEAFIGREAFKGGWLFLCLIT